MPFIDKNKKSVYRKSYYQENKKYLDEYTKNWRKQQRLLLIKEFGQKCNHCDECDPIVLDFDHIGDDGYLDKKRSRKNIIFHVKDNPSKFQLLCKNCNWKKEYWRRIMPSKSKAQAKLMSAAAHSPEFAKKVGVKQSVAKEFNEADAGTGILKVKNKKKVKK